MCSYAFYDDTVKLLITFPYLWSILYGHVVEVKMHGNSDEKKEEEEEIFPLIL